MKGARCSQVPSVRTVRWKLRAAGSVRGKGVENGDGEEPVPGGGVGKGVEGRCQTQKKKWGAVGTEQGAEVSFSFEKKSGVAFLGFQNTRSGLKTTGVGRVRGRADAEAMTIQSQDTAEDCTAASGKLGREAAGAGAVRRAAPECRARGPVSPL